MNSFFRERWLWIRCQKVSAGSMLQLIRRDDSSMGHRKMWQAMVNSFKVRTDQLYGQMKLVDGSRTSYRNKPKPKRPHYLMFFKLRRKKSQEINLEELELVLFNRNQLFPHQVHFHQAIMTWGLTRHPIFTKEKCRAHPYYRPLKLLKLPQWTFSMLTWNQMKM